MVEQRAEARYLAGYREGRAACLRAGSSDAAHRWIETNQNAEAAFLAGYEWAVWDYEDANGVTRRQGRAPARPGVRRTTA